MEQGESIIKVEYGSNETHVALNDWYIFRENQIDTLKQLLLPIVEKTGKGKLVLNFSKVESVSSSLLGLLLIIHKKIQEQKADLEIWNLHPNIQKVFEITKLNKVFKIYKK
jgi:anti-sigma B factor antagonist